MENSKKEEGFREIIIPGDVLDDDRLSDGAKLLYGKIARLSLKTGYCWATNAFLSNTKSGESAKRQIKELIDAGYLKSQIENGYIRKLYICKLDSKLEKDPQVKNDLPPQVKNDPQTLQDSTNLTAAADPPETPTDPLPDAAPAATAPITLQELKEALLDVDKALILKTAFYPKAAAFMAQYGLDRGYIAWLYHQCELRKPSTSFKGLYYTLFFEEDMAEQYAAGRRATASLQPPPPIICPACGETHDPGDDKCPACGLRKDASDEEIQRFRALHLLSPDQRAEYLKREDAIYEECGKNFVKSKSMIESLNSEFGLAAGL